jgi:glycosyltransferase involved in cell wall biosynthesis
MAEMRRASVFVAPARYEPFGLTILEAAANGCALVLSDIPTLRELWDDAALFVPVDDRAELKATLTLLMRNHGLRTKLQSAARKRAERYSLDATVNNYRKLYCSMASPRARDVHAPSLELRA